MNYLITGAAGFIGSHVTDRLLQEGHSVTGIDNFDPYYDEAVKRKNISGALLNERFRLFEVDITEKESLSKIFEENSFDIVIHLAAKAGVRPSIANPGEYFKVNLEGTFNLLESMKKQESKKLIFASSSSVYGNNKKVPFSESDSVDNPISPYAASKKAAELLCYTYHHLYNINVFCLRFFTVYGPRQRPDLAIHKFINKIVYNEAIDVYGDGTTARDYTYIDDIVQGVCNAADLVKGYNIFNLGESRTISLHDMISTIESVLNKKAIIKRLPMQPGDVDLTNADITKSKAILKYNPSWGFREGIDAFINWKKNE